MSRPRCCMNCSKRTSGCHAHCEQHQTEKLLDDLLSIEIRKEKIQYNEVSGVVLRRIAKCKKAKQASGQRVRHHVSAQ